MTAYVPATTETDLRKVILAVQQLAAGRSNAVGTFTLVAGASSTTVVDKNCAAGSVPIPVQNSADAAAEVKNGTMFIASVTNGSFIVNHANNAQTDRTFLYAIHG